MELNVIWIDDQCEDQTGFAPNFKRRCEKRHGIHLDSFEFAIDGVSHLEHNLEKYHAVILDAKGWYDKKEAVTKTYGMHEAIKSIERLAYQKYVPYYVLTAQGDLVGDEEFTYSVGKDKVYYKYSSEDVERLLKQIEDDAKHNNRLQTKVFYHEALNILSSINKDASEVLLDILEALHYPKDNSKFNPLLYYNQLRQILEHIFTEANKYQIIPNACFQKDKVNIDQCYRYLVGSDCEVLELRYGEIGESIVPKHIADMLSMILYLGNIKSHYTKLTDRDKLKLDGYLNDDVGKSHYLIYSLTFQICEIIIWMNNYIKEHRDIIANLQKCKKLNYPKGIVEPIDGITDFYHIGDKYCIESNIVEKMGVVGKHVKVIKIVRNPYTQEQTKDPFQYLAKRIIL